MKKRDEDLSEKELDEWFENFCKNGGESEMHTAEELRKRGLLKDTPEGYQRRYSSIDEGEEISDEEWEKGLWELKKKLGGHW